MVNETLMRMLQRPDMQVSAPPSVNDQAAGPRAANAAAQFAMQLGGASASSSFQGQVSLITLAVVILLLLIFTYWTRGFQA